MDPCSKLGLNVKINDTLHTPRGYEKINLTNGLMEVSGKSRAVLSSRFEMVDRARKGDWPGFLLRLGCGARVRVPAQVQYFASLLICCQHQDVGHKGRGEA